MSHEDNEPSTPAAGFSSGGYVRRTATLLQNLGVWSDEDALRAMNEHLLATEEETDV